MTTSRQKAAGSAAERAVAKLLGGIRVGMDGGPVDVIVPGYLALQVKTVKSLPSLLAVSDMIDRMIPIEEWPIGMRAVVVIQRAGSGRRGSRTITFDLDDWAAWHGD
jgi:hypothetical protein